VAWWLRLTGTAARSINDQVVVAIEIGRSGLLVHVTGRCPEQQGEQ
jgi:hypothetical protein